MTFEYLQNKKPYLIRLKGESYFEDNLASPKKADPLRKDMATILYLFPQRHKNDSNIMFLTTTSSAVV